MGFSIFLAQTDEAKALASNELESLVYAGPEGDFHLLVTFDFCDDAICAGDALGSDLTYDAGDYIRIRVQNDSTASVPKLLQFAFESVWDALIDGDLSVADTGLDAGTFNFVRDTAAIPAANTMPDVPFTTFQRFQADPTSDSGALNQGEALTIVGLIQAGQLAASSPMDALVDQIEVKAGFLRIGGLGGACLESDGCNFLLGQPTEVPTTHHSSTYHHDGGTYDHDGGTYDYDSGTYDYDGGTYDHEHRSDKHLAGDGSRGRVARLDAGRFRSVAYRIGCTRRRSIDWGPPQKPITQTRHDTRPNGTFALPDEGSSRGGRDLSVEYAVPGVGDIVTGPWTARQGEWLSIE